MKRQTIVKKRHKFLFVLLKTLVMPYFWLFKGYRRKNKFDNRKQNVLVLSNHQTDIDCINISFHFRRTLYFLMTDSVTSNRKIYRLLDYVFAPITKKKGTNDSTSIRKMIQVAREGGSLCLFPEGNRCYAEFQYPVENSISKLVRILKLPLIIFNIHGGNGVSPRWKHKPRKGKFYGEIKRIIYPDEYNKMSDDELHDTIVNNLRVYDSESGNLYRSKRRAEYLEKMLFVCPNCNKQGTLYSKKEYITCTSCGLNVEYTKDLHLKSNDESFKYTKLNDWYQMQKKWVKEYIVKENETIFKDTSVRLFTSNSNEQRKLLVEGEIELTDKELIFRSNYKNKDVVFESKIFNLSEISISSVISGSNFYFSLINGETYLVKGKDRFNPLKYVFMFNKLDTDMKNSKRDEYYTLD